MSAFVAASARRLCRASVLIGALIACVALAGCAPHRAHAPTTPPAASDRVVEVIHLAPGQTLPARTAAPAPDPAPDPVRATAAAAAPVSATPDPDGDFPGGRQILAGFDSQMAGAPWHPGDEILYGVRLIKGERSQTWYALIRVVQTNLEPGTRLAPTASERDLDGPGKQAPAHVADRRHTLVAPPLGGRAAQWAGEHGLQLSPTSVLVHIQVYDENAQLIAGVYQFVFDDYLQSGLYESCETVRRRFIDEQPPTDDDVHQVTMSFVSLFSLGELLWGTPHVGDIFNEIVRLPSWISILLNLGVRPIFIVHYEQAEREGRALPALASGRTAYRVPFEIKLNNEPALRCYIIAAPNQPPLQICGGVIGLEGADVRDPQHRFAVRLLAARANGSSIRTASRD